MYFASNAGTGKTAVAAMLVVQLRRDGILSGYVRMPFRQLRSLPVLLLPRLLDVTRYPIVNGHRVRHCESRSTQMARYGAAVVLNRGRDAPVRAGPPPAGACPWPLRVYLRSEVQRRLRGASARTSLVPVRSRELPFVVTVHTPMEADTEASAIRGPGSPAIHDQSLVCHKVVRSRFERAHVRPIVSTSVTQAPTAHSVDPSRGRVPGDALDHERLVPNASVSHLLVGMYKGRLDDIEATTLVGHSPSGEIATAVSVPLDKWAGL